MIYKRSMALEKEEIYSFIKLIWKMSRLETNLVAIKFRSMEEQNLTQLQ